MTLQDMTKSHDEEFVRSAYRTLLRRDPDPGGLQNYLKQLRSGRLNKIEILGAIRSSAEGRQVGVEVPGLRRAYLFQRLFAMPLLGRVLKTAEVAWRLPTIMRNVDGFQAFTCARFSELQNLAAARMGPNASSVLTQRLSALQTSLETERTNREKLEDIVAALERNLQDLTAAVYLTPEEHEHLGSAFRDRQDRSIADSPTDAVEGAGPSEIDQLEQLIRQRVRGHLMGEAREMPGREMGSPLGQRVKDLSQQVESLLRDVDAVRSVGSETAQKHGALTAALTNLERRIEPERRSIERLMTEQGALRKQQEVLERGLQAIRWETSQREKDLRAETHSALNAAAMEGQLLKDAFEDWHRTGSQSIVELDARLRAEIAAREALGCESQAGLQKLGENVEAVRAARSQSVVEHDARWRAEVAAREALAIEAQTGFQRLEQFIAAIRGELSQEISTQVGEEAKHRQWLADHFGSEFQKGRQLDERFTEVERSAIQLRIDLAYLDWRVGEFVEEARKRLPKPFTARQIEKVVTEQDEHKLDALYAHFEDVFRGARPDIKSRQSVYLPLLDEAKAGTKTTPVLDLGCGRGEWLELLRESGLEARGVDTNRVMVKRCQDLGLNANLAQALVHLRSLPAVSLGAVTGFHIIEHMPFASLIDLLDETVRVLKPGGLAIFETPNPQNILVGSCEFYNDPTHLKPVPSHLFRFLAEVRGLCKVEVLNLHPYPEAYLLRLGENGVAQRINEKFYGPQDYSIIGRKA